MSVRRTSAVTGQQLDLRMRFAYDRTGSEFDPDSLTSVIIYDSDKTTVLQTIESASIVKVDTGVYKVVTASTWNTTARTVYDKWTVVIDGVTKYFWSNVNIGSTTSTETGLGELVEITQRKVKDEKNVLSDTDWEEHVYEAVKRYSQLKPYEKAVQLTGDGNAYFDVPSDWEENFSKIKNIEYPLDELPANYIDQNYYYVEKMPSGIQVRFSGNDYPGDGDNFYFRYSVQHTVTATTSTVYDVDKEAVASYAGYLACLAIANYYSQTADSTLEADVVSYRTKGDEFKSRAQDLLDYFNERIKNDTSGVMGEWDQRFFDNTTSLNKDEDMI